ncbi:MAG: hypothetical protein GEU98_06665 [Pseudonocardiaceae bacterium]|nr:hypothetical protein [Pseudonocardiaceae bacterium]
MAEHTGTTRPQWTKNRFAGLIFLLAGLAVILHAFALSIGSWQEPGPGMWPLVIGVALVLASVAVLSQRIDAAEGEEFTPRSLLAVPAMLSLYVFVWAFSLLGSTVPGFLLALFWLKVLGRRSWPISIVVSVVATAVFYVLFVLALGVPFPDDVLLGGR